MATRTNTWRGQRKAHRIAALIGRAHGRRRKGPRDPLRYLAAAGVSLSALRKYRSRHKASKHRKHRVSYAGRGRRRVAVNRGGSYRAFVKAGMRRLRPHGAGGARAAMRKIAAAWRAGRAHPNQGVPGAVYFNTRKRHKSRRNRGRHRARYNRKRSRRNPPVLPTFAWENRKRHKSRRNGPILPHFAWENRKRSRKGRARRNGAILPYAAFNPAATVGGIAKTFKTAITPNFWTGTVLPLGAGFIGAQFAGGLVQALAEKVLGVQTGIVGSVQRIGSRLLGAVAVSALTGIITRKGDVAARVLAGGLVAVLAGILQELLGSATYNKITGMSGFVGGMAADLTDELKRRIAASVQHEISAAEGGGRGVSAFVNTQDLTVAPNLGPGPRVQGFNGMGAFVNTQDLRTAPHPQDAVVADLSAFSDSMADMMLV